MPLPWIGVENEALKDKLSISQWKTELLAVLKCLEVTTCLADHLLLLHIKSMVNPGFHKSRFYGRGFWCYARLWLDGHI